MFIEEKLHMLKALSTLLRGAAAAAEEDFTDRNALLILDQQIRDVAAGVERSKGALALALAQEEAERERLERTRTRIKDLEERAVAALRGGREDLAHEAAEAIASFEADSQASAAAQTAIAAEIRRLRAGVSNASRRLADLRRGRQIAHAAEAVRRLQGRAAVHSAGASQPLAEAEATLRRLRERQAEATRVEAALEALDEASGPTGIAERLEAAGYGQRTTPNAASVLERLKSQASAPMAQA
jgi:phage shock protein A